MSNVINFLAEVDSAYRFSTPSITLGGVLFQGQVYPNNIQLPLKSFNRHGLIAGATGTGKTKSLQVIAEQLSQQEVPVLLMDLKGDLSGLAAEGVEKDFIKKRHELIQLPYLPTSYPVELLTLTHSQGVRLRATLLEFGPVLFSKILDLNDTQQSVITLIYKYCDDHAMPLLDLSDLKRVLRYITQEGKNDIELEYGAVSPATVNIIMRKIVELEQQGADKFFGEPSFDVQDLLQVKDGKGLISILRLSDMQDKPMLFSTFMLSLLAEIYAVFPEVGDLEKPKLVLFIDEAHLIFQHASKALLQQLESIIKLIRSKGVGIFFCTQVPGDIPPAILSQLGLKVQHALRAFTAKDRKEIKLAAENFPISKFYNTDELLTNLGIGEALVTGLNEKGIPTPLVACYMRAPQSRMDILTEEEITELVSQSNLVKKYEHDIDIESAHEILSRKIQPINTTELSQPENNDNKHEKKEGGWFSDVQKNPFLKQVGTIVVRELTRGLLGALGVKKTTSKRKLF